MNKQAEVISLRKRRLRKARAVVRARKLSRWEGELALDLMLRFVERLQVDLDHAVRELRELRQRKKAA
jgi:hypothetical protein